MQIDHEIISMAIVPILLNEGGQLSITRESAPSENVFKKGSCQFLEKECAQYWLTTERTKPAQ